ncbi:MAG TPA: hypothetical protein VFC19_48460 [Candidatus Limnocylindrales bacterium]|nr:hypothetical protein [Candidatus Limnocylindrales bacterium]
MWLLTLALGVLGIVVTVVGVVADVGSWLGWNPSVGPGEGATGQATPTARTPHGPGAAANLMALADLPVQAGAANLTELPKALRENRAYAGSLVIACPTNQSSDKQRDVTYLLRGRHSGFAAQVQSSFPGGPTLRATLTLIGGFKERDGTITRRELGSALATAGQWSPISADVELAEELTLQARCDEPGGVLIISGGQVSR